MSRTNTLDREFGKTVARARKASGLSQTQLARAAGIPHQTIISRIEGGTRPTSISEAVMLAAALDIPLADLIADQPPAARVCPRCDAIRSMFKDAPA